MSSTKTDSAVAGATLIPGQAVTSTTAHLNISAKVFVPSTTKTNNGGGEEEANPKRRRNRPRNRKKKSKASEEETEEEKTTNENQQSDQKRQSSKKEKLNNEGKKNRRGKPDPKKKNRDKNRNDKDGNSLKDTDQDENKKIDEKEIGAENNEKKKRSRNRNRTRNENRRKYPWRKFIPNDCVDPISLDPLNQLTYPPFALCISPPYELIDEQSWWKPVDYDDDEFKKDDDRQARILHQQWGNKVQHSDHNTDNADGTNKKEEKSKHYHLFDGKCLAYYIVSTCQFIDPLNRRDLTKQEIYHLDQYMNRYNDGKKKSQVYEAYLAQGTPALNSAGIASQTQQGRAQLLQQEASVLLNALYSNNNHNRNNQRRERRNNTHATSNQPPPTQEREEMVISTQMQQTHLQNDADDVGIYVQDGMIMIDDDDNPGLRGGIASSSDGRSNTVLESRQVRQQNVAFPTLASTTTTTTTTADKDEDSNVKITAVNSAANNRFKKALSHMVKKTDPKEMEKQKKAREEAQRRAALAQLSFQPYGNTNNPTSTTTSLVNQETGPTSGQLDRNQMVASALGIKTNTLSATLTGWSRPTDRKHDNIEYDMELVRMVKENPTFEKELPKLERKWITFLQSSVDASVSLRPMDRALRIFVHTYSDYWKLQTQSYDPEPRRYIHCTKMRDTCAPYPLLSTYIKTVPAAKWRNIPPTVTKRMTPDESNNISNSNDECSTMRRVFSSTNLPQNKISHSFSRELLQTEERKPLKLHPPSSNDLKAMDANTVITAAPPPPPGAMFFTQQPETQGGRFAMPERERPKLQLAPRTLPLANADNKPAETSTVPAQTKVRKIRQPMKKKPQDDAFQKEQKSLIEAVFFASDDEQSDDDSDWEVGKALYTGSDEE